ncbi:MAG: molybdate ABC transporter substrate-binding protein [Nitrospirota bacterium]
MKKSLYVLLAALILSATPAMAADLTVSAAISLTESFKDIKTAFEKENPGTNVTFNFGASGTLLQQIKNGAPVDVFASADEQTMDKADKGDVIAKGTRKDFASNALVLIVPAGRETKVSSVKDLGSPGVQRIAVGNPEFVPVGHYTKKALLSYGLWDMLSSKFIYAENVRQVLDYVARGEVDAGFVYITDAATAKDKVKVSGEVGKTGRMSDPIAVVNNSKDKKDAVRFVDYVTGEKGREILSKHGFKVK